MSRVILAERIEDGPSQELNLKTLANVKSKEVFESGTENENNCDVRTEKKALCFRRGSKVERKISVLHLDGPNS